MKHLVISPALYYGFLLIFFLYDMFVYLKFGRKKSNFIIKTARWGCVLSFLVVGIAAAANQVLPAAIALPPAIFAALLSYYVMFVKYLPEKGA